MDDLAGKAEHLRSLHHGDRPLVLANVWDAASARAVAATGARAIATSSAGIAHSLGFDDGEAMEADAAFAALARIVAAVDVPVTADLESGYGLAPAELVDRLLEAGAVGCNLEDTDHARGGVLRDVVEQAERLAAVCRAAAAAGVGVVVNARVDVYLRTTDRSVDRVAEAMRRGRAYVEAGAACVYPIGAADRGDIQTLVTGVGGPVNVFLRSGVPPLADLASIGVARVSVGSGLHRVVTSRAGELAAALLAGDDRCFR
ncbi:MAG: isocitrate lyase/PEP mutase family protein [Acidimicrobiales bacterium]